jgi:hypothetical protein
MRSFKKVWAELSNPKTGYLERQNFAAFFGVRYNLFFFKFHMLTVAPETQWDLRSSSIPRGVQCPQHLICLQRPLGPGRMVTACYQRRRPQQGRKDLRHH